MRRVFALLLALGLCFFVSQSYAASMGNPIKPLGNMKLAVTAEGNMIYDRDLEAVGTSTTGSTISKFELSKVTQGYAKLALGVTDHANVFVKAGSAKINGLDLTYSTSESVSIETDNNLLYGGGINLIFPISSYDIYFVDVESDFVFFWGVSGNYTYFKADADEMYIDGANAANVSGDIEVTEYQAGVFVGIEIPFDENASFAPYVGGFWNECNVETNGVRYNTEILNFDSDAEDEYGPVVGIEVIMSRNVSLNAEGRFFGGHAISFGGTVKF